MSRIEFIPVASVAEACRLLKASPPSGTFLMAGGTDLLVLKRHQLIQPRAILYLKRIPGLVGCRPDDGGGLVVGALTTLDEIAKRLEIQRHYPLLAEAARAVGSPQVRHKATLCGNICLEPRCWFYNRSPFWRAEYPECRKASGGRKCYVLPRSRKGCRALRSGDTVGPLVALGARLRLISTEGARWVEAEDFFLDDGLRHLALGPGEILTEILLPRPKERGAFLKFRPQNNLDFATFTLSVLLPAEGAGARIVVGSVATRPLRARRAEEMLDRGAGDVKAVARTAAQELKIVSFVRGSPEFKRQAIEASLVRVLGDLSRRPAEKMERPHEPAGLSNPG
ncbi:MAG: FAD binding domain-containing protein [Thermodesulfobacteriota bacterium]